MNGAGYDCAGNVVMPGRPPAVCQPPAPVQVPIFIPATQQAPTCMSRRVFWLTIPKRFWWAHTVTVAVGSRVYQPRVMNGRTRVVMRGLPCGIYSVRVAKRGVSNRGLKVRLYTAGPNGDMTGVNLR
jgi:hypothetical protein